MTYYYICIITLSLTYLKRFLFFLCFTAMLVGCEMLSTNNDFNDNGNNESIEEKTKLSIYQITEDIDVFESVFLAEDGYCLAIKEDTTFGYVAVIDSLKADDEKALVVYIDSLGKVKRVFNDGKSLDISYNSDENINLWYREADGTSEVFNEIKYTSTKAITKAGEVFDPTDFVSIGLALLDLKDLGDVVVFNPLIGEALKANIVADLLTTGPFSNTTTEILTGVTSVAITAAIGTSSVPIAVLLATIGVADAVISDWQNMVADSYFGTATPITGDAVQLTDNHFVISYSLNGVNPNQTDFNIGVIIADGLYITNNHHLLKKSISYDKSDTGYIIVNLKELDNKKGDKLKYRIYLEPANENGFKWDDKLLDYWRYGEVKNFIIDEPALKIESAVQTNATSYHGYKYSFSADVNVTNNIPLNLEEWGVAIYSSWSEECTSEDDQYDIKSANGKGNQTISFSIDVDDVMMDIETTPNIPTINHFAVPYIIINGDILYFFDISQKITLQYMPIQAKISHIEYIPYPKSNSVSFDVNVLVEISKTNIVLENNSLDLSINDRFIDIDNIEIRESNNMSVAEISFSITFNKDEMNNDFQCFSSEKIIDIGVLFNGTNLCSYKETLTYTTRPEIFIYDIKTISNPNQNTSVTVFSYQITGSYWIEQIKFEHIVTDSQEFVGVGCPLCQSALMDQYFNMPQDLSYSRSTTNNNISDGRHNHEFKYGVPLIVDDERFVAVYKRANISSHITINTTDGKIIYYEDVYRCEGCCGYAEWWHFEDGACPSNPSTWPD